MPNTTIQDAIKRADLAELRQAHYNRDKGLQRAGCRQDPASIASYTAAAAHLERLQNLVAKRRRALG